MLKSSLCINFRYVAVMEQSWKFPAYNINFAHYLIVFISDTFLARKVFTRKHFLDGKMAWFRKTKATREYFNIYGNCSLVVQSNRIVLFCYTKSACTDCM